jgi:hypothetical protein
MEYFRIKTVGEADFDDVVRSAGGSRLTEEGSADYLLNEAIIELKLIAEEGFEKKERQKKLASLFLKSQQDCPVVVVDPKRLKASDLSAYYRIVEGPIKTACKKASKQLKATAARLSPAPVRVLVILNIGYTLLSPDEFREVCLKCVLNDTSGIDWVICGGIYFHSDKWDNYTIELFQAIPFTLQHPFPSHMSLGKAWESHVENLMTDMMRKPTPIENSRMPLIDLVFDLGGVRYVKPVPKMPSSSFWPDGVAPRENSSGIDACPAVARVFPSLREKDWRRFKQAMPSANRLKGTYKDWLKSCPDDARASSNPLKPLVLVEINYKEFTDWIKRPRRYWLFQYLEDFCCNVFQKRVKEIAETAKDKERTKIIPLHYIHLIVYEVGNDKANDFASIYYVSEVPGFGRKELVVKNARLFLEYGLVIASAYAVKNNIECVFYTQQRYG